MARLLSFIVVLSVNAGYFGAVAEATGRSFAIKSCDGRDFPGSREWPANYFLSPIPVEAD